MNKTITYTMDEICDRILNAYKLGHDDGFAEGRCQGSKDVYDKLLG